MKQLIGPFKQLLTMDGLPEKGAISDNLLEIIEDAGFLIENDIILKVGFFHDLKPEADDVTYLNKDYVVTPGLIDSHTHICYSGSRARDYTLRISGVSYQEIAKQGGGIKDTVQATRKASKEDLKNGIKKRTKQLVKHGVTTCEVKSGYGLSFEHEVTMLEAIHEVHHEETIDLIPTCLAAHVCPPEFDTALEYVEYCTKELFPVIKSKALTNRVDIFIEENAFGRKEAEIYLRAAKNMGFDITIHADQFSTIGSELAIKYVAISADHLEASTDNEILELAKSDVIGTVLPGASLGLGMHYAPARNLLDAGVCVAIASDWNPGSAPMGDLLLQAALLGASEKLSMAETWAGITLRAAKALNLSDRGMLKPGFLADFIAFPTSDFREILYHQGMLKPELVFKKGKQISID